MGDVCVGCVCAGGGGYVHVCVCGEMKVHEGRYRSKYTNKQTNRQTNNKLEVDKYMHRFCDVIWRL